MIYVWLTAALSAVALGGWMGYTYMDGKVVRAEVRANDAEEISRLQAKATKAELIKEVIVTNYVNKIIKVPGELREVIKTVTITSPPVACVSAASGVPTLNGTVRLLHDSIARKASSAYASAPVADGAAAASEDITVKDFIDGIADNYTICAENALKLKYLQQYELDKQ